jgi:enolase-phosphatase E1
VTPGPAGNVANVRDVGAIVLDIEGTTTPIAFVYDVLFPFARAHLGEHLRATEGSPATREAVDRLTRERADDVARGEQPPENIEEYARWLMDRDRKSPGLKLLQGHVWERGYRSGALRGEVFADVIPAIRRWHDAGLRVAIYSSGSVLAQQLLFESTVEGDVTTLISAFFDTSVGPKTSTDSYRRIAKELDLPARRILFVSDVTAELMAAREAGMQVLLSCRPGNASQTGAEAFASITSFDQIPPS